MHTLVCASNTVKSVSLLWQSSNGCAKSLGPKHTPSVTSMLVTKLSLFCHLISVTNNDVADSIIRWTFLFLIYRLKVKSLELRNQNEDFEEDSSGFIFLCLANCVFSFSFQYRKTRYCWSQTKHSYPSGGWHDAVQVSRIYLKSVLELLPR